MSSSLKHIRSAVVQSLTQVPALEIPLAYPNTKFDSEGLTIWGQCFVHLDGDEAATLGADGEDEVTGYLQVNIKLRVGEGEALALDAADKIRSHFKIGFTHTYEGLHVTVSKRKIAAFNVIDEWFTVPILIHFYCRVQRGDD